MRQDHTERGFQTIWHPTTGEDGQEARLLQQASAIGDQPGAFDNPGSSYLWIGKEHRLNQLEVALLAGYLLHWLASGQLFEESEATPCDS